MTPPPTPDAEQLAALIDGRLNATQAQAVREQLALADQDSIDALVDSIAIAGELRANGAGDSIVHLPDRVAARRTRSTWIWGGMAAAAAAAFVFVSVKSNSRTSAQDPLSGYVASLGAASNTGGDTPWSEMRGGSGALTDRARAARIGVLLAQLELGRTRQDDVVTTERALAALIRDLPGQSRAADILSPAAPRTQQARDDEMKFATQSALVSVDSALSRSAAYVEFARLAAQNKQLVFFDRFGARDLDALRAHKLMDATMHGAVDSLSAAIASQPRDMSAIGRHAATVLRVLTY